MTPSPPWDDGEPRVDEEDSEGFDQDPSEETALTGAAMDAALESAHVAYDEVRSGTPGPMPPLLEERLVVEGVEVQHEFSDDIRLDPYDIIGSASEVSMAVACYSTIAARAKREWARLAQEAKHVKRAIGFEIRQRADMAGSMIAGAMGPDGKAPKAPRITATMIRDEVESDPRYLRKLADVRQAAYTLEVARGWRDSMLLKGKMLEIIAMDTRR